jgi:hypothetical protein
MAIFIVALMVALIAPAWAAPPGSTPQVINHDGSELPALPSFDAHPDGRLTFVWSAYERHLERLWTTTSAEGRMSAAMQLSPGVGIYTHPRFVATGGGRGWTFWTRQRDGRWEVVARQLTQSGWTPLEILSEANYQAMVPAAAAAGARVVLAFERHAATEQIALRTWNGRHWMGETIISDGRTPSYRPTVAASDKGEVWAFWDAYLPLERNYGVFGRRVMPEPGLIERLSPEGRNCLKATAIYTERTGWAVAWVETQDAVGGVGVLDHLDRIQVARRTNSGWQLTQADPGDTTIVPLAFGLTPRMEPNFEPVWGYSGRRRHPLLVNDSGSLWLLWESRIRSGGPAIEPGRLCARRFEDGRWSTPVVLHEGLVEYATPENGRAIGGRVAAIGRDIEHRMQSTTVDLNSGKSFSFEPWTGWKPVRLPLTAPGVRPSIEANGKRYQLFWGDLHVHSVLTPDAEGEVDELIHFARDKSLLDVVVIQENDSNSWSKKAFVDHRLNASEYALSVYYSRRYTRPGRFVALPGFEWSQRTLDDNRPNHRTVMYAGSDTPIVRHTENGNNFDELCQVVSAAGGNMFTQHEAFRLSGCPADTNVEIATGWGIYIRDTNKIHAELSSGHRFGFVATSDGHRRNPGTGGGLTGIFAEELTPQAILDALKKRRVYATNGSRIFMDARANGRLMGEELRTAEAVNLSIRVVAPKALGRAVLVRDGVEILSEPARGAKQLSKTFADWPTKGSHWYYWRIELEGEYPAYGGNVEAAEGKFAWSSPHYVMVGN